MHVVPALSTHYQQIGVQLAAFLDQHAGGLELAEFVVLIWQSSTVERPPDAMMVVKPSWAKVSSAAGCGPRLVSRSVPSLWMQGESLSITFVDAIRATLGLLGLFFGPTIMVALLSMRREGGCAPRRLIFHACGERKDRAAVCWRSKSREETRDGLRRCETSHLDHRKSQGAVH